MWNRYLWCWFMCENWFCWSSSSTSPLLSVFISSRVSSPHTPTLLTSQLYSKERLRHTATTCWWSSALSSLLSHVRYSSHSFYSPSFHTETFHLIFLCVDRCWCSDSADSDACCPHSFSRTRGSSQLQHSEIWWILCQLV